MYFSNSWNYICNLPKEIRQVTVSTTFYSHPVPLSNLDILDCHIGIGLPHCHIGFSPCNVKSWNYGQIVFSRPLVKNGFFEEKPQRWAGQAGTLFKKEILKFTKDCGYFEILWLWALLVKAWAINGIDILIYVWLTRAHARSINGIDLSECDEGASYQKPPSEVAPFAPRIVQLGHICHSLLSKLFQFHPIWSKSSPFLESQKVRLFHPCHRPSSSLWSPPGPWPS